MEANIDKLGDEKSDLTNFNREDGSINIHFQFHNKPTSFTGTKKFKIDREDSVKIPGVNTPSGVVIQQGFEEHNRKVLFKKSHARSINLDLSYISLLYIQSTMDPFCNLKLVGKIYKAKKI